MSSVWYIGEGIARTIRAEDWTAAGHAGRPATSWDSSNGYSVPQTAFTAGQLTLLDADDAFVLTATDGPRPGAIVAPGREVVTRGYVEEKIQQSLDALSGELATDFLPVAARGNPDGVAAIDGAGKVLEQHIPARLADAALSATYEPVGAAAAVAAVAAPKLDLISKLVAPVYVSHRGGPLRFPEHSMEGYRESARTGFLPELDIQALADGTLVMLHDTTTGRTMTGTNVAVNTLTRDQWLSRRIKPAIPGGKYAMPVFWDDVLNEFGGRVVLVPEIKATDLTVANKVIDSIVERGLQKSVLAQSFDWDACLLSVAAGVETLYLTDAAPSATWLAAGVKYIGAFTGWGAGHFTTLKNMGYKTIPYTVNTRADANTFNGVGVWGMFSDDPWAISGRHVEARRDPYAEQVKWIGSSGYDATKDSLVPLADGSTGLKLQSVAASTHTIAQGWAGPLPSRSFTIEFTMQLTAGAAANSGRFYLSDTLYTQADETQSDWMLISLRRSGEALIYKRTGGGAIVTLASATWASLALADGVEGTPQRFQYSVNAAGDSTFKCLGTGDAITAAGAANTASKWLSLAATNGAHAVFSKIALTY